MSARNNAKKRNKKERTKKNGSGAEDTPFTPIQAIDARMGGKRKEQKEEQVKETESGPLGDYRLLGG